MSNTLLTNQLIAVKALQLFRNSNAWLKQIPKQFQDMFGGSMSGGAFQIRKPIDPTVRYGATAVNQTTAEQYITLTINSLIGVDLQFTETDLSLSIANFSPRFIEPAVNNLGGGVAAWTMPGVDSGGTAPTGGQQTGLNPLTGQGGGIPLVANQTTTGINDGGATASPTSDSILYAGALLTELGCPIDGRSIILSPFTMNKIAGSLKGLLNPVQKISSMFEKGIVSTDTLQIEKWFTDPTVLNHVSGAYGALANVSGANQTGSTITVGALAGPLVVGDIVMFPGVNFVNRTTKQDSGIQATFCVTQAQAEGDTSISIYPPLTPPSSGNQVNYQTVTASPTNSQPVTSPIASAQAYRNNFLFHPASVTIAFVPLPENEPGTDSSTQTFDGMSLRVMRYFNGSTMVSSWRLDTLFGSVWPRSEWAVRVPDTMT